MLIRPFQADIIPNVTVETSGLGNVVQSSSEPPDYTIVRQITSSYLPPSQLPVGRMLYAPYPEMVGMAVMVTAYNNTTSNQTVNIRINTTREDGSTIITSSDCSTMQWIANNNITNNFNVGSFSYAYRGYTIIGPVGGYLRIKLWCTSSQFPIAQLAILSIPVVRILDLNSGVIWGRLLKTIHVTGNPSLTITFPTLLRPTMNTTFWTDYQNDSLYALALNRYDYPLYTISAGNVSSNSPFGYLILTSTSSSTPPTFGANKVSIIGYIAHFPTLLL